jgi:rhodanese-related sulfurtransferase
MTPLEIDKMSRDKDGAIRLVAAQSALLEGKLPTRQVLSWLDREPKPAVRNVLYLCAAGQARSRAADLLRQRLEAGGIDPVERLHVQAAISVATSLRSDMLPVLGALRSSSRKVAKAAAELVVTLCSPEDLTTLDFALLLLKDRRDDEFTRSIGAILAGARQTDR